MKTYLHHSHKKRKDSLEALDVLRIYVENQAMLEPILLHLASEWNPFSFTWHQNGNKPKSSAAKTDYGPMVYARTVYGYSFYRFTVSELLRENQQGM